jgi:hypothetical protein
MSVLSSQPLIRGPYVLPTAGFHVHIGLPQPGATQQHVQLFFIAHSCAPYDGINLENWFERTREPFARLKLSRAEMQIFHAEHSALNIMENGRLTPAPVLVLSRPAMPDGAQWLRQKIFDMGIAFGVKEQNLDDMLNFVDDYLVADQPSEDLEITRELPIMEPEP